ncbi:MAG: LytR C-terminal domain-containing protein, partial [Eubacteriales bacterium]|nr:LytR C-terminal domain-containing protein [Eubacteriales bacterium]
EEVTTEEPTTEQLDIPSTDKKIMLLNSTNVSGLARGWSQKLSGAGFAQTITGNYTAGASAQTKIYVPEEGMGNDLVSYFKDAVIEIGKPAAGTYTASPGMSESGTEIYIVIGNSDTTVQ